MSQNIKECLALCPHCGAIFCPRCSKLICPACGGAIQELTEEDKLLSEVIKH